jgi:nitrate reductase NapAB chaperone NapD
VTEHLSSLILTAKSEELQMTVNELNKISKKYDKKISISKTKARGVLVKTYKGSK